MDVNQTMVYTTLILKVISSALMDRYIRLLSYVGGATSLSEGALYIWRKSPKKVAENRKKGTNSAENWKRDCAGNRKMPFFSHGKPEKFKEVRNDGHD